MNPNIVLRQVRRLAVGGALFGLAYGALKALRLGEPYQSRDEIFRIHRTTPATSSIVTGFFRRQASST